MILIFRVRLGLSLLKNQTTYSGADLWFDGYTDNTASITDLNEIYMEKGNYGCQVSRSLQFGKLKYPPEYPVT